MKAETIVEVVGRLIKEIDKKITELTAQLESVEGAKKVSVLSQLIGYRESEVIALKLKKTMLNEVQQAERDEIMKIIEAVGEEMVSES